MDKLFGCFFMAMFLVFGLAAAAVFVRFPAAFGLLKQALWFGFDSLLLLLIKLLGG